MSEGPEQLPVVILCGGRGLRLQEHTQSIPKPLVEIGGRPIVWHVIQIYAAHGFKSFLLSTGYKGEQVERFVREESWPAGIDVQCVNTGEATPTGGRIANLRDRLEGGTFAATYSDGVADINLRAALAHHREFGGPATMTVVKPRLQFGVCDVDGGGRITGFSEKPRAEHWINGGFFFFEPAALDYIPEDGVLEREPLERLAAAGRLHAYRHEGFWECMDTYKDALELNDLFNSGDAPWLGRVAASRT